MPRKFEPDPVRFTSMEEMEACENHLLSTLTRMVQRRVTNTYYTSTTSTTLKEGKYNNDFKYN